MLLPPHIREAIQTLADAGSPADQCAAPLIRPHLEQAFVVTDEVVGRIALGCRRIVQGCLREDGWQDADREFFRVIKLGLGRRNDKLNRRK
jgi:hypothetical protein